MAAQRQYNKVPQLTQGEIGSIKACWAGEATEGQQRLALETIINKLATTDVISYEPGSFDESAFLAGRSFVGKQIRRQLKSITKE